jgi:cellulose biosynthesis protein BcsQ
MIIVTYNFKGGEGKTKIATNLALTMNYSIVTNDVYSPIDKIFSEDKILKLYPKDEIPDFDKNDNIVFDLGGYADARIISVLKKAKHIIIPITNEEDNIEVAIGTIDEIEKYNKNIIIVVNKATGKDFEEVSNDLKKIYKYPIFAIKKSRVVRALTSEGKSIREIANQGGLNKYNYSKIAEQFDELINFITK